MRRTAKLTIGNRSFVLTNRVREDGLRLAKVISFLKDLRGQNYEKGYVLASVEPIHTFNCRKAMRSCTCGADDLMKDLLK